MKLWLLEPTSEAVIRRIWTPWYDKMFAIVVRAETEQQARTIATAYGADEVHVDTQAWLSADLSTCIELTADGKPEVIISDIREA